MKDFKIETESPLSIEKQINVLELSKKELKKSADKGVCEGCCIAIVEVLSDMGYSLFDRTMTCGIRSVIPCFTRENAIISNIGDATGQIYWWDRKVSKGGLTNRLAFLDWLIERLKEAERENTKRTTTE